MVESISSAIGAAGYSWATAGKDHDGDGKITREEFKLPVIKGTGTLTPADLRSAGSLDDAFNAYDKNKDGIIDSQEAKAAPVYPRHPGDRFSSNGSQGMSSDQVAAYFKTIDQDNATLAKQWGINV
ncbi:EF-hand domain-containing protein [Sphingomonas sp. PAMC 26605]|uniref:EF-hand domain-containing protein n=1 Tax=Sphingomonas sp. PAMC 26605 TaxID=1112214 RepID=UPI00026CB5C6|nr:EF-hand domain-containing protein [Sphingomonas sp. PAMC 26605]